MLAGVFAHTDGKSEAAKHYLKLGMWSFLGFFAVLVLYQVMVGVAMHIRKKLEEMFKKEMSGLPPKKGK